MKYESVKNLLRGIKSDLFKTDGGHHNSHYTADSKF